MSVRIAANAATSQTQTGTRADLERTPRCRRSQSCIATLRSRDPARDLALVSPCGTAPVAKHLTTKAGCVLAGGLHRLLRVGFAAVRVLLVVNPAASSVTTRARVAVERILRESVPTDVVETARRGHAAELARDAVVDGYDVVVVLAGDGTLNEAGGGLAGSSVALAPLPGGSTNVFARTLGVTYKAE